MDKIEFGKFIYNRRKKFNLSQQALANELCLSNQAISNWERGVSYPEISYLEDISKVLKISIENICLLKQSEENEYQASDKHFNIDAFSKNIAILRKLQNMSQTDLAQKLNVQYQTISSWERGVSLPSIEQIVEMSKIFNTTIDNLYYGNNNIQKEEKVSKEEVNIQKKNIKPLLLIGLSVLILSIFLGVYLIRGNNISNSFKINFEGFDEKTETKNNRITKFPDAQKEGFIFLGWYYNGQLITEDTIITSDMILTPKYERKKLVLKFVVEKEVYKEVIVDYGSNFIDFPDVPFKLNYQGRWEYTKLENIKEDIIINAIYEINKYNVKFYNEQNDLINNLLIGHGEKIGDLEPLEKEGYTFLGWYFNDKQITEDTIVTTDMILTPKYVINTYKITFMVNGVVYKVYTIDYNTDFTDFPEVPKKIAHNGYWDTIEVKNIKKDIVITAIYKIEEYQVVLLNDNNEVIDIQYVKHGETIKDVDIPIKEGYTFIGWSEDLSIITSNIKCKAMYKINQYTVTFVNDGAVVNEETVDYNTSLTLPTYEKRGYSFDGFLYKDSIYKESITVKENITLIAQYTKLPIHNIIFKNEEGEIIKTIEAFEGEKFSEFFEYESEKVFSGWMLNGEYISYPFIFNYKTDIVLYASFVATTDLFMIMNLNDQEIAIIGYNKDLKIKSLTIPDCIDNKKVVRLARNVFNNDQYLEYIKLGEYVTKIDDYCFENCVNLKEVYLNNNITSYGEYIFKGCNNFETIHISGDYDNCFILFFGDTSPSTFKNVYINEGTMIKNVDIWSYSYWPGFSPSIDLYLPTDLEIIKQGTFSIFTWINNIYIRSTVLKIETGAFSKCDSNIIFKEKVKDLTIETNAFQEVYYQTFEIKAYKANIELSNIHTSSIIECDYLTLTSRLIMNEGKVIFKCKEIEEIERYAFNNSKVNIEIYGIVKKVQENGFNDLASLTFYDKQDQTNWHSNWCGGDFEIIYKYQEEK